MMYDDDGTGYRPDPQEPDCADCGSNAHFTGECEPNLNDEFNPQFGYLEQGDRIVNEEERLNLVPFAERVRRQKERTDADAAFERALAMARSEAAALTAANRRAKCTSR